MACICIKKYTSVPPDDYFFFDPYLWGSLGPPETLGFLSSPGSPWELRIKKKIVGIFMFHMLKTL